MATPAVHHRHRHATSRRRWIVWLGLVAGVLAGGLAVLIERTVFSAGPRNSRSDLQRVIGGLVAGPGRIAPGVTAFVAGPHGVSIGAAGIATIGAAMRPDARLRLNSVGKLWTATLILKLVGEGRMKLDDTVSRWLPGLLPYGNQGHRRAAAEHDERHDRHQRPLRQTGVLHQQDQGSGAARASARGRPSRPDRPHVPPTRVWIEAAAGQPRRYQPGSTWHYSNIGYMVLGASRRASAEPTSPRSSQADHRSAAPAQRTL